MIQWLARLRHELFHEHAHYTIEREPGEVYVRCGQCGLRSRGLHTGPLRVVKTMPGDPERHRLVKS